MTVLCINIVFRDIYEDAQAMSERESVSGRVCVGLFNRHRVKETRVNLCKHSLGESCYYRLLCKACTRSGCTGTLGTHAAHTTEAESAVAAAAVAVAAQPHIYSARHRRKSKLSAPVPCNSLSR